MGREMRQALECLTEYLDSKTNHNTRELLQEMKKISERIYDESNKRAFQVMIERFEKKIEEGLSGIGRNQFKDWFREEWTKPEIIEIRKEVSEIGKRMRKKLGDERYIQLLEQMVEEQTKRIDELKRKLSKIRSLTE